MSFDCDLVLREDDDQESRVPRAFIAEVRPGTALRLKERDWIIIEIHDREGGKPEVVWRTK